MTTLPIHPSDDEQHHPETAYWMATLANWAYRRVSEINENAWEERLRRELTEIGFYTIQVFDQAFLATHNNGFQVLVIRGSDSPEDWVTNLTTRKTPWHRGQVHAGFYEVTSRLALQARIDQLGQLPLYIAGHSQGGAVAVLLAACLQRDGQGGRIQAVYTFGQPRVGNREFAAYYDRHIGKRTFRHVHCADAVPRLPGFMPDWLKSLFLAGSPCFPPLAVVSLWPGGFRHAGTLIYSDRRGKLHRETSLAFRLWDRTVAAVQNLPAIFTKRNLWRPVAASHHNQANTYVSILSKLTREAA